MADVVNNVLLEYERGRKMYRDGKPCPPMPYDRDGNEVPHDGSHEWMGWRIEFGAELTRRREVRERARRVRAYIEHGVDL